MKLAKKLKPFRIKHWEIISVKGGWYIGEVGTYANGIKEYLPTYTDNEVVDFLKNLVLSGKLSPREIVDANASHKKYLDSLEEVV